MGPPPKRFPKATRVKGIRMTAEECDELRRMAKEAGCTESDLVRHLLVEYARLSPKPAKPKH